jgi:hypothetical protein
MLTMVTHLTEGNKAGELLNMVFIVIVPDLMTMQRNFADLSTGLADTATVIIFGIDQLAQVIPVCASYLIM